ncbi:hypothetical protein R50073_19880 [Maricurvus nonylphenolicus]|uniref:AAA family ATPase n=1 Tax=Maricurvus nonylphenolicus TaxID=1008307 RepID=UPI0036F2239F
MSFETVKFPFSAVAGQASFKLALILAAINPRIGGVLISGPRGCAKSTLARGMADLLPGAEHNFVTLPLGATDEMLVGTLDLQKVLDDKTVAFNPGLLARAHGGVLYVDEVNLLGDSLVDLLLDVAASGVNHVERDGISHSHAADFILVGTMNPDEGELRPQLQDRFGLAVELTNQYAIEERVEIVRAREDFDRDPQAFIERYQSQQQQLVDGIADARRLLKDVSCPDPLRTRIAEYCHQAGVDGLRADIVWMRAAMAHAAWAGRTAVTEEDIDAVAELVLLHRRNSSGGQGSSGDSSGNGSAENNPGPSQAKPFQRPIDSRYNTEQNSASSAENNSRSDGDWGAMLPESEKTAQRTSAEHYHLPVKKRDNKTMPLLRQLSRWSSKGKGRVLGGQYRGQHDSQQPDWFRSLLANRGQWPLQRLIKRRSQTGQPVLHLILLDTSASTLQQSLFAEAKAAVLAIADKAYCRREQITILGFGNQQVDSILPRVQAPKQLRQLLDKIRAGGGTPLRQGLSQAKDYIEQLAKQYPELAVTTYILTDGRSTQSVRDLQLPGKSLLIDIESSQVKRGRGAEIARDIGADYFSLALA